ncbi:MAG: hypothetical protein Q4B13_01590 [Lautropia sp.]|nr:hypothetical protein [Lautropia sp.]
MRDLSKNDEFCITENEPDAAQTDRRDAVLGDRHAGCLSCHDHADGPAPEKAGRDTAKDRGTHACHSGIA